MQNDRRIVDDGVEQLFVNGLTQVRQRYGSGGIKPARVAFRKKATNCSWSELVVKPHQRGEAYKSLETVLALKTVWSSSSHTRELSVDVRCRGIESIR